MSLSIEQLAGTPMVADGLVWIGTIHKDPDVKRAGLLKCFRERDGKLLYEYESPMHKDALDRSTGTPWLGISSTPLVEGDRLWFTSLGPELVCLDIAPLKRGEDEPTDFLETRHSAGVGRLSFCQHHGSRFCRERRRPWASALCHHGKRRELELTAAVALCRTLAVFAASYRARGSSDCSDKCEALGG